MRKTKLSSQEIADMDAMNKTEQRKAGFQLMPVRDRGIAKLSNGSVVRWHTPAPKSNFFGDIEVVEGSVPDGMFQVNGVLFDAEELRKFLRWA